MGAEPALIGRDAELALFDTALARAPSERGTVLFVVGDGGMGKTALLEHYLARSRAAGLRTAWATVPDAEGAPPFWPWASVLRDLAAGDTAHDLITAADALTTPDAAGGSPAQERFRTFDRVTRALCAADEPIVVVLDDLHRADGGTLRLLEFLVPHVRHSRVLLLLGARPAAAGDDLAGTFGTLIRAGAQRVDLRHWSVDEVALVTHQYGLTATERTIEQIQRLTGGNPFFVLELLHSAHRTGALDLTHVPPTIVEVLAAEARRLAPLPLDILRLSAAWGQGMPLEMLAGAAGQTPAVITQHLPSGFLSFGPAAAVWFRHDLVRDAVYQGVPAHERAELHARLATTVERSSTPPDVQARQIAVHGCRAGTAWNPDAAFAAALTAARDARSMLAIESAASYLDLANSVRRWCRPDPARDLDFLITFGDTLTRAGDRERARPVLDEAITLARTANDARALSRIALIIGLGTESAGMPDPDARRLLDEALVALSPDEHHLRARLLARKAWQALAASDPEELIVAAEAAVIAARASGDPGTIAQALNAFFAATSEQPIATRRAVAREITAQAVRARDIDLIFSGLLWEAQVGLEAGDIQAARDASRRYHETAEQWPLPYHAWYRWILQATLAFLDDRLDDAAAAIERLDPAATTQQTFAELLHASQRMELAARRGDRARFEATGATVLTHLGYTPVTHAVRAHLDACLGRRESAVLELDRFVASLGSGPHDNDWLAGLTEGAFAAVRLEAREHAERLFEELIPFRGRWAVIGNASISRGPVSAVLAALARLLGDADGAAAYLAEARTAVQQAATRGAFFWLEGGPRWTPVHETPTELAGLTNREIEVLALVAAGYSNQEIADRLVLSVRTVQRHVENIYAKTGARGRAAASVFAATHGLLPP